MDIMTSARIGNDPVKAKYEPPVVKSEVVKPAPVAQEKTGTSKSKEEKREQNSKSDSKQLDLFSKRRAEYKYHEEVNRISIKIIDEVTQEVIREIPPEKSIEILKELMEIPGLFLDEKR